MLFLFSLFFDVFHQIRRLTVEHFTDLIKRVNRQMLDCACTNRGNSRRPNPRFFRKILLRHIPHCKHNFNFEFDQFHHASLLRLYHAFRIFSILIAEKIFKFRNNCTNSVLTNYVFRSKIRTVKRG